MITSMHNLQSILDSAVTYDYHEQHEEGLGFFFKRGPRGHIFIFISLLKFMLHVCFHLFSGCIAFIGVAVYFLSRPSVEVQWQEKAVFSAFFAGAILCMGFSFLFHTMFCHSERVGKLFNK